MAETTMNLEDYQKTLPELLGQSNGGQNLQMRINHPVEIEIWHQLMDPELPRLCPNCEKIIDNVYDIDARVDIPLDPDNEPLAITRCEAFCPNCKHLLEVQTAEYGYPFISAQLVQQTILRKLKEEKRKAGGKHE